MAELVDYATIAYQGGPVIHVTHPRPTITLGASLDDSATGWLSEVLNEDPAPATATTYAICVARRKLRAALAANGYLGDDGGRRS